MNKPFKRAFYISVVLLMATDDYSVAENSINNQAFTQTTAFKTDYNQWKEYLPYQLQEHGGLFVSEKGPLFHLLNSWNYHGKRRFGFDLSSDFFYGNPDYLSHNYNTYYDTILTGSATTQYVGMNLGVTLNYDFTRTFFKRIYASLSPLIGVNYSYWKRSLPWVFVYLTDTYYVTYWGYDEYWYNLLAAAGVKLKLEFPHKFGLAMDITGSVPGYVLERTDNSNAANGNYEFDLKPKLKYRIDGKATVSISRFFMGVSVCRIVYHSSAPVHVEKPKDEYRYQPQSIGNYYGVLVGYVLPIGISGKTF